MANGGKEFQTQDIKETANSKLSVTQEAVAVTVVH